MSRFVSNLPVYFFMYEVTLRCLQNSSLVACILGNFKRVVFYGTVSETPILLWLTDIAEKYFVMLKTA